jgi:hypothetical protein
MHFRLKCSLKLQNIVIECPKIIWKIFKGGGTSLFVKIKINTATNVKKCFKFLINCQTKCNYAKFFVLIIYTMQKYISTKVNKKRFKLSI